MPRAVHQPLMDLGRGDRQRQVLSRHRERNPGRRQAIADIAGERRDMGEVAVLRTSRWRGAAPTSARASLHASGSSPASTRARFSRANTSRRRLRSRIEIIGIGGGEGDPIVGPDHHPTGAELVAQIDQRLDDAVAGEAGEHLLGEPVGIGERPGNRRRLQLLGHRRRHRQRPRPGSAAAWPGRSPTPAASPAPPARFT